MGRSEVKGEGNQEGLVEGLDVEKEGRWEEKGFAGLLLTGGGLDG